MPGPEVADVEDVHALEAGLNRRAVAVARLGLRRVPRAHEDVPPDDDVTLIAVAARPRDQLRVAAAADDPEAVVVAVEHPVAPEREVRVGVPRTVGHQEAAEV